MHAGRELKVMFPSSNVSLHCLSQGLNTMYKDLLSCHMCEAYWRQKELKDVDIYNYIYIYMFP